MRKAVKNYISVGRMKDVLEKKLREVEEPLPARRIKHLKHQIARMKSIIKVREEKMAAQVA
jgi:hypothetical protein